MFGHFHVYGRQIEHLSLLITARLRIFQRRLTATTAGNAASWHTAHRTRQWIRAYNRRAKRLNLPRLIVCVHPSGSPWLMPLELIFGWTKRQALGRRVFDTLAELQAVVEHHFRERAPKARLRRTQAAPVATSQKSRFVS